MAPLTLLLVAVGVSADAFAVAVGKGLGMRRLDQRTALTLATAFGLAQGLMPLLGWLLGSQLERYVMTLDHWVAFVLLSLVGVTMVREALSRGDDDEDGARLGRRELAVLSVATSVDALAVGIGLAFLDVDILVACALIGATTFVLSLAGVVVGHRVGARVRRPAGVLGGLVLVAIGVEVLVEHLGG